MLGICLTRWCFTSYTSLNKEKFMDIVDIVEKQRKFFESHITLDYRFRINALKKLKKAIIDNESKIEEALKADLGKSVFEGFMCEVGMTLSEITFMIKNLKKLMRKKIRFFLYILQFLVLSFLLVDPTFHLKNILKYFL